MWIALKLLPSRRKKCSHYFGPEGLTAHPPSLAMLESVEASAGVYQGLLVVLSWDGLKSPVLRSVLNQNPARFAPPKIPHFPGFYDMSMKNPEFAISYFAFLRSTPTKLFSYQVAMRALFIFLDNPTSSLN